MDTATETRNDGINNDFERQVIRATHRAAMGAPVHNWMLAVCADIMLKDLDPTPLPLRAVAYAAPHYPPRGR